MTISDIIIIQSFHGRKITGLSSSILILSYQSYTIVKLTQIIMSKTKTRHLKKEKNL